LLGGFQGQLPMNIGRNPDDEFPAVRPTGQGSRRDFAIIPHFDHGLVDRVANPAEGLVLILRQPAEARELRAEPDIFLIIFGPGDPIGIAIMI
jgi:hypothetical protein